MALDRRLNRTELSVGIALVAVGLLAAWEGSQYRLGSLTSMGPGMFPTALGFILAVLGIASAVEGMRAEPSRETVSLRAFIAITLGVGGWSLLIEPFGLAPATIVLVVATAFACPPVRPVRLAVLAACLYGLGDALFIRLLGLPVTPFGR